MTPRSPEDPTRSPTEVAPATTPRSKQQTTPLDDVPVVVAGRYEIVGLLGSGAMGTVYRARDRELDEIVALKVLKSELAQASGMLERFRREVKLARKVTHRNVARTFDIGEHEGERFLTMEFIEGEMLGTRLERVGRLSPCEAIAISIDVATGLAAAHEAGVLHRDLKPENVIVKNDGRAVITDFGIARALTNTELTATFVGTPGYMAPEQVEGLDLDARADLYALGTMLFELLTGRMAWSGDSIISMATARLRQPPPDPRNFAAGLPESLAAIVLKLMARHREDRYSSAIEVRDALRALGKLASEPAPRKEPPPLALRPERGLEKAIAVLPLLALSGPEDTYLAESVTDDIVDQLSVVPGLRIRPLGMTTRFRTADRDVRDIGRIVSADAVVDGSLRRVGDRVRIAVRLIAIADGFQLWARRFDRTAVEVLDVADEATQAIAQALATNRIEPVTVVDAPAEPEDPIAQDLYLRARHEMNHGWFERMKDAVDSLRNAHERAPKDRRIRALLALGLARAYRIDAVGAEAAREARVLADAVLEEEPENLTARVAIGALHWANGEASAAAHDLAAVLKKAPTNVDALDLLGRLLLEIDQVREGIKFLETAMALEPTLQRARHDIARVFALRGDMEACYEKIGAIPHDSKELIPYLMLQARLVLWQRDAERGKRVLEWMEAARLPPKIRFRVQTFLEAAGNRALTPEQRLVVDEMAEYDSAKSPRRNAFVEQLRTEILLAGGEVDDAMLALRTADVHGLIDVLWLRYCPLFEHARGHATFKAVEASVMARADRIRGVLGLTG